MLDVRPRQALATIGEPGRARETPCTSTLCTSSSSRRRSCFRCGRVFVPSRRSTSTRKVRAASGLTGAQAAQRAARSAPASATSRSCATHGMLSDHYNPLTKKLALSEPVYGSPSIAAIGVACHEAGHAIQHAEHYAPLWLRSVLVPTANIGSSLGYIVMVVGLDCMGHECRSRVPDRRAAVLDGAAVPDRHAAGRVRRLGAGQEARRSSNGIVLPTGARGRGQGAERRGAHLRRRGDLDA